jgi:hypothetical protein
MLRQIDGPARIAGGQRVDLLAQEREVRHIAKQRAQKLLRLRARQGRWLQLLTAAGERAQRIALLRCAVTRERHEQTPLQAVQQRGEHSGRRRIDAMDIVDGDQERPGSADTQEQLAKRTLHE